MRFGDRLRVTFDIADEAQQAMVPCFVMQPLIENAIVHGLRGVRKTGVIGVRAAPEDGSTCERLARMYPERQNFSLRKSPEGGAEVRIAIPLRCENPVDDAWHNHEIPIAHR